MTTSVSVSGSCVCWTCGGVSACQAAEGVQLGLAAPETVTCIAASLTVHGFTAAAGLALQSSCNAADLRSICKVIATTAVNWRYACGPCACRSYGVTS